MRGWLREPLLHFALLGAGLFLLYRALGSQADGPTEIVITARTIEGLAHDFHRVWDRPPTREELDRLIEEQTKEEVYYRAAVAAGLDRDDSIVRRRLRQKMEFLAEETVSPTPPTQAQLESYFQQHAQRYREEGSQVPALADVRNRVERDWLTDRKARASDALYEKLRRDYSIRVEPAPGVVLLPALPDAG